MQKEDSIVIHVVVGENWEYTVNSWFLTYRHRSRNKHRSHDVCVCVCVHIVFTEMAYSQQYNKITEFLALGF